jgi:macrolide transport system ATP-binding/permease protein
MIRLAGLFGKHRREREMQDEIESHIAMHVADNVRTGMTDEEAQRDAVLKLGGIESLREAYRERNTVPFLEHLTLDIRFAFRQLRNNPGFAATAVLILALAICASVAIFAFVDAALIRPLPYPRPTRLVAVTESNPQFARANLSYLDYLDWKASNKVFESMNVSGGGGLLLKTPAGVEPIQAVRVSAGFFHTLGVRPFLGRDFTKEDEVHGGPHTVLVTYPVWKRRFGARKSVLGEVLNLSGEAYTVIGVLPKDFQFAPRGAAEFWTTIDPKSPCAVRRSCHNLDGIARLNPGVSVLQAQADMTVISRRLESEYPDSNRGQGASVVLLGDAIAGNLRLLLSVLMGGAALLLAIACVNVASLVLVRSESRRREMALRMALGASMSRIVTQFITEAFILVASASLLGLVFAHWTTEGLTKLIPADMLAYLPFLSHLDFNWRVLGYAAILSALALAVFSMTPVLHLTASTMRDGLVEGSRGSAGKGWRRLGSRLVVVELALAMILLVGAGLCGKSLYRLMHVELGFQPDHLATIEVAAPDNQSVTSDQSRTLGRNVVRKIASLPGVRSVGLTTVLPVSFNGNTDWIRLVGKPYDGKHIEVNERDVSSEYFRTIGATLLHGRYFSDAEDQSKPKVVVVNETLVRKYFPGEDPIGKQIGDTSLTPESIKTIIGVVKDIRDGALDSEIWPAEYRPFNQDPSNYFSVIARTWQRPETILAALRPAIRHVDSDVGTRDESTVQTVISNSMTAYLHRASTWLVGGFAVTAFLLGIVGLYGVTAYSVSQRTREIGVRMALGAERGTVYRLVLREACLLAALGIGGGTVASIIAATSARKMLFGVSSWDVETLLGVAALLGIAALVASFIPARRAASVSPMEALRAE